MKKLISLLFVCGQIAVAQTEFSTFMADGETPTLARGPVYYGRSALLSSDDIKGRNFVMYSTDNPALIVVNASSNLGYCHAPAATAPGSRALRLLDPRVVSASQTSSLLGLPVGGRFTSLWICWSNPLLPPPRPIWLESSPAITAAVRLSCASFSPPEPSKSSQLNRNYL